MGVTILVVDDSKADMIMIKNILDDYQLLFANDGVEAMEVIAREPEIDLMILDLKMPRMNGFEVLEAIQAEPAYQKIITLILTNYDEAENEIRGLSLGAVDYIRKPLNLESLRKRIEIHVKLKNATKALEQNNAMLEQTVAQRTQELVLTRNITIHALVGLLEIRDIESSNHTRRTQWMVKALCEQLRTQEAYHKLLSESYIKELFETAPLHDIGKVGIPDNILLKPGKLTIEEYEIMKKHAIYGVDALRYEVAEGQIPSFIKTAIECIAGHHEKYDGTGYPYGLKGEAIPLPGRVMAIVDVYDALISKRVYKPAFTHETALLMIKEERGKHFDPAIVDAFLAIADRIKEIATEYSHQEQ
ncbi:HD-GYP domain-containing protein [Azotosporobacter soli]|uniref:HD-GYP domain-containing protein n=1 Tax=Azotosporobacter soli TaxID=3055040 RepID=UPI0031FE7982